MKVIISLFISCLIHKRHILEIGRALGVCVNVKVGGGGQKNNERVLSKTRENNGRERVPIKIVFKMIIMIFMGRNFAKIPHTSSLSPSLPLPLSLSLSLVNSY